MPPDAPVPAAPVTPAPAPAPESAAPTPAAKTPEPAPVAEAAKAPVPPPSEVAAETKPAAETPPVPQPESLLGKKPEEARPPEPAKPKAPEPAPEPAPPDSAIEYTPFTLPDGVEPDAKIMSQFTDVLKGAKVPQEAGQKLMDLYVGEMSKIAQAQQDAWQKTLDTWKDDVISDPELGGNRHQTVLKRCLGVLIEFGDDSFRDMLNVTGVGNHPAMFRFLNKVAGFMSEPRAKSAEGAKPVPQAKPTRAERRYRN